MREEREAAVAEALYYHIAGDALRAGRRADSFERAQQFTVCMVFSALALEAYINRQLDRSSIPGSNPDYERMSPEDKWMACPGGYGSPETFDRGAAPFQDFSRLIRLRNQRLVHFKPKDETVVDGHGMHARPFTELVYDENLAASCLATVPAMIRRLSALTAGQTEVPAFLEGSRYLKHLSVSLTMAAEHLGPDGAT